MTLKQHNIVAFSLFDDESINEFIRRTLAAMMATRHGQYDVKWACLKNQWQMGGGATHESVASPL